MAKRKAYLFGIGSPDWMRKVGKQGVASIPGVRASSEFAEAFGVKPKRKRRRRKAKR